VTREKRGVEECGGVKRFEEFFVRDGKFVADGVPLEGIAEQATPLYVYSAAAIRRKYQLLKDAFPDSDICYSLKANPHLGVLRVLKEAGAGAEVSSTAELAAAVSVGFEPGKTVYVAPVKEAADMEQAITSGIRAIAADARVDLELIESTARKLDRKACVLLRINTRESRPEAKEVMVGGPSKFGFDEEQVSAEVAGLRLEHAQIAGIQVYSASQVLDKAWLAQHLEYVIRLARKLSRRLGFPLEVVDFGGGFGVPQTESDSELDLAGLSEAVRGPLGEFRADYPECRLLFESGRYLVAEAGVLVTRVVRVKESRGRVFALCDGGMNAFSRPVFMHVRHPAKLLNRLAEPATTRVDICGPICTPLDCIAPDAHLPRPKPGDLVGLLNAGAYGYTMSLLKFMSRKTPCELLADAGRLELV